MILASSSPQRAAILAQLGIAFEVVEPHVQELTDGDPERLVIENARRKASAVAALQPLTTVRPAAGARPSAGRDPAVGQRADGRTEPVLGVDTIVALGDRLYGKPADAQAARETLTALSGRSHRVLSGVCVVEDGELLTGLSVTTVSFRKADVRTLDWYLRSGEWQGRAGGYAIQGRGAALIEKIDGDYSGVVGLPVSTLLDLCPSALFPAIS